MTEKVFRLKGNVNLWDYLESARERAWIAAHKRIGEVYEHWLSSPDNELTIRRELNVPANIKIQPQHCTIYLNILYDQARGNLESPFNLDARINIQRFMMNSKSRYAVIPESYGIFSDIFSFMNEDKELNDIWFDEEALVTKEFLNEHNVTEDEWVERAEIYVERLDSPYDILSMDIINQKIIIEIDPNLNNIVEKLLVDNRLETDKIESDIKDSSQDSEEFTSEEVTIVDDEEEDLEDLDQSSHESNELEVDLVLDDSKEIIEGSPVAEQG